MRLTPFYALLPEGEGMRLPSLVLSSGSQENYKTRELGYSLGKVHQINNIVIKGIDARLLARKSF